MWTLTVLTVVSTLTSVWVHLSHFLTCLWRVPLTDSRELGLYTSPYWNQFLCRSQKFSCESHILLSLSRCSFDRTAPSIGLSSFLLWVKRVKSSRNEAFSEVIILLKQLIYQCVICVLVPRISEKLVPKISGTVFGTDLAPKWFSLKIPSKAIFPARPQISFRPYWIF